MRGLAQQLAELRGRASALVARIPQPARPSSTRFSSVVQPPNDISRDVNAAQDGGDNVSRESQGPPAIQAPSCPRLKLAPLQIPSFSGDVVSYPEWRRQFQALMRGQNFQDEVMLIYLKDALPKEARYVIDGVATMERAWERIEDRYGDSQHRVLLIYEKLAKLDLRGKEFERLEKMYFEAEKAEVLLATMGAQDHLVKDLHIVGHLLAKLTQASTDKWYAFVEDYPEDVVNGRNAWLVFKSWLARMYRMAKRARLDLVTSKTGSPASAPSKPPARPICQRCRMVGHRAAECDVEPTGAFATEAEHSDNEEHRAEAFVSDAERVSKYHDAERRFGKCIYCKQHHTYRRKVGDEVMDWPSERLYTCSKFMALPLSERVEFIENKKLCPRCLAWNIHDKDKCPVKGYACRETDDGARCKRNHHSSLHQSKSNYCDAAAVVASTGNVNEVRILLAVQELPV